MRQLPTVIIVYIILLAGITITPPLNAANTPPVLNPIGNQQTKASNPLVFTATATDNESQNLTFTIDTGAPAGTHINANTGVFTWTPTGTQTGQHHITIRVWDDGNPPLNDYETFTITVSDWSDTFDANPLGQLTNTSGWQAWIHNTTSGIITANESRSSPHSLAFTTTNTSTSNQLHTYSGYTTGTWVYTLWQYLPSDFSGHTFLILMNSYHDDGNWTIAAPIAFNATNISNGLGKTHLPIIKNQWIELRTEIDLSTGTWRFFYHGKLLSSFTVTSPKALAAVLFITNGNSTVYYDDMSLVPGRQVTKDGGGGEPSQSMILAEAGGPYHGRTGDTIYLNATRSHSSGGAITRYDWQFTANDSWQLNLGPTPTYTYQQPGTYLVTLRVTDSTGNQDTDSANVTITPPNHAPTAPTIDFLDNPMERNRSYTFTFVSTDPDGDSLHYHVEWGDGSMNTSSMISNGSSCVLDHVWAHGGIYVLNVTAMDDENATSRVASHLIAIDAVEIPGLGYLVDNNSDGIYEAFYNMTMRVSSQALSQNDGTYLLDINNDGQWEYRYSPESKALTAYAAGSQPQYKTAYPLLIIVGIITLLIVVVVGITLVIRRTRK